MTDTGPPTNPGNIDVLGQRRTNPLDGFPNRDAWSGVGEIGGPQGELTGDSDSGGSPGIDPCSAPESRREWNVDAAAAAAKKEMERKAGIKGDDGLYSREWFAYLYERPDGSVYVGPVAEGFPGYVVPDNTGQTADNLLGWIHNHPGGTQEPSGDDWLAFDERYNYVAQNSSGGQARADQLRMYMILQDNSGPTPGWKINVYGKNSSRNTNAPAPQVNPEGQPCP